jgi:hypothetical protein
MVQGQVDHADDFPGTRLGAGAARQASPAVEAYVRCLIAVTARFGPHEGSATASPIAAWGVADDGPEHDDDLGGDCEARFGEKRRPPDTSAM